MMPPQFVSENWTYYVVHNVPGNLTILIIIFNNLRSVCILRYFAKSISANQGVCGGLPCPLFPSTLDVYWIKTAGREIWMTYLNVFWVSRSTPTSTSVGSCRLLSTLVDEYFALSTAKTFHRSYHKCPRLPIGGRTLAPANPVYARRRRLTSVVGFIPGCHSFNPTYRLKYIANAICPSQNRSYRRRQPRRFMIPYSTCLSIGRHRDARLWVVLHDVLSPYPVSYENLRNVANLHE